MGLSVKVTSFIWVNGAVAGTNYDVTCGFTPKFVILHAGGSASATDACGSNSLACAYGFGVSSSDRRSMIYYDVDAATSGNIGIGHVTDAVLSFWPGSDLGSLDIPAAGQPDLGIRFTVDTALGWGANLVVTVIAVGGDDITSVKTGQFQEPNDVTDVGFTPTGMLFFSNGYATAPDSGSSAQGMAMFGATDGTRSWVLFGGADDAAADMDTRSYMKSGEVIALGPEPAVTLDARAAVTGFDVQGVNLSWTESASTRYIHYLAWAGGQFRVDNFTTATDTNEFTEDGYGFQPLLALFASACRAESTADTPTNHTVSSFGAATSASEMMVQGNLSEDNVNAAECAAAVDYDKIYVNINTSDAVQGLMQLNEFIADGMKLQMTDQDPGACFVGVAAWAANAAGGAVTQTEPDSRGGMRGMLRGIWRGMFKKAS